MEIKVSLTIVQKILLQRATDLNFLIFMKLMVARFLIGFQKRSGIKSSQNDLPMAILTFLLEENLLGMLLSVLRLRISLVGIYKGSSTIWIIYKT